MWDVRLTDETRCAGLHVVGELLEAEVGLDPVGLGLAAGVIGALVAKRSFAVAPPLGSLKEA